MVADQSLDRRRFMSFFVMAWSRSEAMRVPTMKVCYVYAYVLVPTMPTYEPKDTRYEDEAKGRRCCLVRYAVQ